MFPLWLYTLGRLVMDNGVRIHIPFQNILISLLCLLIPVIVGIVVRLKRPRAAKLITKILKPFYIAFIIFMFTFGIYTNLYIFRLIKPMVVVSGCLLPYCGFIISGAVAFALRQPWKRVYTISIETGMQNAGIAMLLMKYSLPQPDADLSLVAPVMVTMFTPFPLWVAVTAYLIRKKCCLKERQEDPEVNGNVVTGEDEDTKKTESAFVLPDEDENIESKTCVGNGSNGLPYTALPTSEL